MLSVLVVLGILFLGFGTIVFLAVIIWAIAWLVDELFFKRH